MSTTITTTCDTCSKTIPENGPSVRVYVNQTIASDDLPQSFPGTPQNYDYCNTDCFAKHAPIIVKALEDQNADAVEQNKPDREADANLVIAEEQAASRPLDLRG